MHKNTVQNTFTDIMKTKHSSKKKINLRVFYEISYEYLDWFVTQCHKIMMAAKLNDNSKMHLLYEEKIMIFMFLKSNQSLDPI